MFEFKKKEEGVGVDFSLMSRRKKNRTINNP